jgi:hypothetical protein
MMDFVESPLLRVRVCGYAAMFLLTASLGDLGVAAIGVLFVCLEAARIPLLALSKLFHFRQVFP